MKLPRVTLALAAILAVGPTDAGQLQQAVSSARSPAVAGELSLEPVYFDVRIRADGSIAAVRKDPAAVPALSDPVAKQLLTWKFKPAIQAGKPVEWLTRVVVALTAVPVDKGYALRVARVHLSELADTRSATWAAPKYPIGRERRSKAVIVLFKPGYDQIESQIVAIAVNGKETSRIDPFASAARLAITHWKIEPLRMDGAAFPPPLACVSVWFSLDTKSSPDSKQQEGLGECQKMHGAEGYDEISLLSKPEGTML